MSRSRVLLWIGFTGLFILVIAWLLVSYITAVSLWLWFALMILGTLMCSKAAIQRSRWFYLPASLGVVVMIGITLAVLFGK